MTHLPFADHISIEDLLEAELYLEMLIARDQRRTQTPRRLSPRRARTVRASSVARVSRRVQPGWIDPIRRRGGAGNDQADSRSL
jgi:hypothetical protein